MKKLRDGTLVRWERETMLLRKKAEGKVRTVPNDVVMTQLDRILDLIQRLKYERLQVGGK